MGGGLPEQLENDGNIEWFLVREEDTQGTEGLPGLQARSCY